MSAQNLLPVRVARKVHETSDICRFELVAPDGAALPAFDAGAHVEVHTPAGPVRAYSLCNAPGLGAGYEIAVLREPASRGGSQSMHAQVQEGDLLRITAPRNLFPLADDGSPSLLLAGGIGITPMLCMAHSLAAQGRAFALHYCTRTVERTAFRDRLAAAPFAAAVHHHYDDGPAAQRLDLPALLAAAPQGCHLYVCGPAGLIEAALAAGRAAGWPEARLHREFFGAEPAPAAGGDAPFELELARSKRVVVVSAHQSAAEALHQAGVALPLSCEQGVCGTCLTGVLAGEPDHRDLFLSPQEQAANNCFLPCRSRARSARLVLDL